MTQLTLHKSCSELNSGTRFGFLRLSAGPLLVVLVGYLLALLVLLRLYDFNPTGPVNIGDHLPAERFWTASTIVFHGGGYDGQYFYYLAHDPLLMAGDPAAFLDRPAYRYGRILYPALAWAAAAGRPEAIPWALLAINVVAALVGTAAAIAILQTVCANRWFALGFAFSPAVFMGVTANLSEPIAYAGVTVGIACYLRGRHGVAGLAFMLAVLAREISVLVPIVFVGSAAIRVAWRQAAAYSLPLILPLAWHIWVWIRLGATSIAQSPSNFGLPFSGALDRAYQLLSGVAATLPSASSRGHAGTELPLIVLSIVLIVLSLAKLAWRRDALMLQLWVQALLALCTAPVVWAEAYSYARVLGLFYLLYGLVVLTEPKRLAALAATTSRGISRQLR